MSALVSIESIPLNLRQKMADDLIVRSQVKEGKKTKYTKKIEFHTYDIIDDDKVAVPFAYYYQQLDMGFPNADQKVESMKAKFRIPLFERQKGIREETFEILNESQSVLLSLFCGFGKTLYALYLACKIGYKTVIVCHRLRLITQWKDSILKACGKNTNVQILKTKDEVDPDADFYIINATILSKRKRFDLFGAKTAIVDEAHLSCTQKYSRGLNYLFPQYFICLTATPLRSDGQDKVLELFVGPNMIYRPLRANFNVYLYHTGFKPETRANSAGDLDWNGVLASQAQSRNRTEQIIDLCRFFCRRHIIVLCKRKDQGRWIHSGLLKYKENAALFVGSTKTLNLESRIIISTCSKGGVGFDCPNADMLIIAADVEENFVQYLGRVFRRENHYPIVVDLIDLFRPLQAHAKTRTEVLKECGGQIYNFKNYFKAFDVWRKILNTDLSDVEYGK